MTSTCTGPDSYNGRHSWAATDAPNHFTCRNGCGTDTIDNSSGRINPAQHLGRCKRRLHLR